MKKKYFTFNIIITVLFLLFVSFNIFKEDKEYSHLENRYLKAKPELTADSVKDGSFMKDAESYSNDQLIFRDWLVKIKAWTEWGTGKSENNGVYFAKDGYLIEAPKETKYETAKKNTEALKKLAENDRFSVTYCIIPGAFEIYKDKLPYGVYDNEESKLLDEVNKELDSTTAVNIKVESLLKEHDEEYIFYRTDHHQTSDGSYLVYEALSDALGYIPIGKEDMEKVTVTKEFFGTTYSKGFAGTYPDEIYVYETDINKNATVEFYGEEKKNDSIFFTEHLANKDKYSYFLDGNHALTIVKSGCENGKKLAIFKDSYAHSIVPFLINHFESIHLIDTRYFGEDPFYYLKQNGITDILFLYGSSTFMSESSIETIGEYAENSPYVSFGQVKESAPCSNEYFSDAVFLGDSLTLGFRSYSGITEAEYLCRTSLSVGGVFNIEEDGTSLIDKVKALSPGKIYVMLGMNELITMGNKQVVMDKYRMVIDALKRDNPDALIYMQSMLPVAPGKEGSARIDNAVIRSFNETLLEITKEKEVYYLDVHSAVADENGNLFGHLTNDGVHLGSEGCALWADYIKSHAIGSEAFVEEAFGKNENEFADGKYNLSGIAEKIRAEVVFEGMVDEITTEALLLTHGIEKDFIVNALGFVGGGATAEEVALFETKTPEDAAVIKGIIKDYIEERRASFESYVPKEIPKLDSAVLYSKDNFVALIVADDIKECEDILENVFE